MPHFRVQKVETRVTASLIVEAQNPDHAQRIAADVMEHDYFDANDLEDVGWRIQQVIVDDVKGTV